MKTKTFQQNKTDKKVIDSTQKVAIEPVIDIEQTTKTNLSSVCRISTNNKIKFCNFDFIHISGYTEKELLNHSFDLVKHPEMPEVIVDYINYHLEKDREFTCILKNKTKEGKYYWTLSNFNPKKSSNYTIAYTMTSIAISEKAKSQANKLYQCLYKLETKLDKKTTFKYLIGFLEERCMSFTEYTTYLASLE